MKKFFLIVFILSLTAGSCSAQVFNKGGAGNAGRGVSGKKNEPRYVLKAKKKQEAKDRKIDSEYKKFIKWSRKRTVDIQTAEVQARMKKDKKDTATRERLKRKKLRTDTKKAGRKYK